MAKMCFFYSKKCRSISHDLTSQNGDLTMIIRVPPLQCNPPCMVIGQVARCPAAYWILRALRKDGARRISRKCVCLEKLKTRLLTSVTSIIIAGHPSPYPSWVGAPAPLAAPAKDAGMGRSSGLVCHQDVAGAADDGQFPPKQWRSFL